MDFWWFPYRKSTTIAMCYSRRSTKRWFSMEHLSILACTGMPVVCLVRTDISTFVNMIASECPLTPSVWEAWFWSAKRFLSPTRIAFLFATPWWMLIPKPLYSFVPSWHSEMPTICVSKIRWQAATIRKWATACRLACMRAIPRCLCKWAKSQHSCSTLIGIRA